RRIARLRGTVLPDRRVGPQLARHAPPVAGEGLECTVRTRDLRVGAHGPMDPEVELVGAAEIPRGWSAEDLPRVVRPLNRRAVEVGVDGVGIRSRVPAQLALDRGQVQLDSGDHRPGWNVVRAG